MVYHTKNTAVRRAWPAGSQDEEPAAWCRYCKGEIYAGEAYYLVDGRAVCTECLDELARDYFRLYRIETGT